MKVKGNNLQSKLTVYGAAQIQEFRPENREIKKSAKASSDMDWVDLSGQGQMVADAQRAIALIPDVRVPLVSQIQNDLQDGAYVFDHMKSAESMLRESFENQAALMYLM
ncbi:flagellar biosynthesis anti-sigma factor FlgM [Desulfosarcina ovata]|uniref:Anti-sigma-28 factor FlgM C-terminal domain-containing protein n=2 Tax=Desulfosarcina ovata TaxID=83564 RepID=A0A5K8AF73_9BACT|nr:flagellar biosynthesis anti-sigma factor FlgM [Desulfosarcina ovata]BBO84648.1 hypothetical protein DSCO28_52140 [Desulfosarcina ovata subsp. sediminis]BBO91138.1 hypothetical protein DSCOOX_43180 [Desulfosarcina ovata subsp. ovata]